MLTQETEQRLELSVRNAKEASYLLRRPKEPSRSSSLGMSQVDEGDLMARE